MHGIYIWLGRHLLQGIWAQQRGPSKERKGEIVQGIKWLLLLSGDLYKALKSPSV